MSYKQNCPGFGKNLEVIIIKCPQCQEEVEFFSDDIRRRCPNCHREISRDKAPSCVDWCKSARQCLGERLWKDLGYDSRH
ncbi:MAG: phosphohydrolase [Candidatus Omnitrophota bacterium]